MPLDRLPARSWLLAAIAAWAVLLWLLALFGMGGRIGRLPADPSLVGVLPSLAPLGEPRLGPASHYAEASARPAFSADRRLHPFFVEGTGDAVPGNDFDVVLTSVLITPSLQMVILQPNQGGEPLRIKLGEAHKDLPAWRLAAVHPRSAVFEGPDGRRTLDLRIFTGGVALASPAAGDTANASQATDNPPAVTATQPTNEPPIVPTPSGNGTSVITPEQQMQLIRQRIESRRAQLRQQQGAKPGPGNTPSTPASER